MGTTAKRVADGLSRRGLRVYFDGIENNPATSGEVVLWYCGGGKPVYSVAEAVSVAKKLHESAMREMSQEN